MVVILDPVAFVGTERTAVLLVLLVDLLVHLQLVGGGAAEGALAALDRVLDLGLQLRVGTDPGLVLTPVLGQQLVLPVHDDLLGAVLRVLGVCIHRFFSVPRIGDRGLLGRLEDVFCSQSAGLLLHLDPLPLCEPHLAVLEDQPLLRGHLLLRLEDLDGRGEHRLRLHRLLLAGGWGRGRGLLGLQTLVEVEGDDRLRLGIVLVLSRDLLGVLLFGSQEQLLRLGLGSCLLRLLRSDAGRALIELRLLRSLKRFLTSAGGEVVRGGGPGLDEGAGGGKVGSGVTS